jgi:hypothetical protein
VSYETVVNLIGSIRTTKGLRVKAKLDKKQYGTGKKISDDEMDQLNIKYDKINPQWNYNIYPGPSGPRTRKTKSKLYFGLRPMFTTGGGGPESLAACLPNRWNAKVPRTALTNAKAKTSATGL